MNVAEFLDLSIGRVKIYDDDTGRLLCDLGDNRPEVAKDILKAEINYVCPALRYFSNSKKAEYSASISIYI